jgi:hypothetical protein
MQSPLELYLQKNGVENNRFFGLLTQTKNDTFVFTNVISKNEGNLLIDEKGNRESVWLGFRNDSFELEKYYEFSIFLNENKYLPNVDLFNNPPIKSNINPYEEIVLARYEKMDRPEPNKIIANLLREIGKGMYSSKERMIFELLQNADDAPAGEELKFYIDVHNGHVLIMHNGLPFNKNDVSAITSAAQSSKTNDKKKTGYKGIGFKSVFTDSQKVVIKSGGFLFCFDRTFPAYRNFEDFYFDENRKDYQKYPGLILDHRERFEEDIKNFAGLLDIPWQLLPLWKNEIDPELKESTLLQYNNNVGIAINVGEQLIRTYLDAIEAISLNPVFLLFLRHVKVFKSVKNNLVLFRDGDNPVKITKLKSNKNVYERQYFKKVSDDILLTKKAFEEENISIFRIREVNDYGQESYFFSRDMEGRFKIENIPPKIAAAESTIITFAAPIIDNKLRCEPDYLSDVEFNSFFTYLPLTEKRIRLPFLVNADFVLSSNREGIQGDNEWNIFLFAKIGRSYLNWLKEIAQMGTAKSSLHSEYLSLLLKNPLADQKEVQGLITIFNNIYLKSLEDIAFIVDYKNELRTCSEIILDETGFSKIFGEQVFYDLQNEDKYLVLDGVNTDYLKYEYLDIAQFDFLDFLRIVKDEDSVEILKQNFIQSDDTIKVKYLEWIEENVDVFDDLVFQLFFFSVEKSAYSLAEILGSGDLFLRIDQTIPVTLLNKLGLKEIELQSLTFPNVIHVIISEEKYLNPEKGKLTFNKLTKDRDFTKLTPKEKGWFIGYLQGLKGVGPDTWAKELMLFKSQGGSLRALQELTSNAASTLPNWLGNFIIDQKEENALDIESSAQLILITNVFNTIICDAVNFPLVTKLVDVSKELSPFYSYCVKSYDEIPEIERRNLSNIPWLYNKKSEAFQLADSIYFPTALDKARKLTYKAFARLIEQTTELLVPYYDAVPLKKTFKLGGDTDNLSDHIPDGTEFTLEDSNLLLDFLKANKEEDFFSHFYFEEREEKYIYKINDAKQTYFSKNKHLISLIEKDESSNLILLSQALYQSGLNTIGLLEEEDLINYLLDADYAQTEFVELVYPFKTNEALCSKFINELSAFSIDSGATYDKTSSEFKVVELLLNRNTEQISQFRQVVTLDGEPLSEKSVSDDIWFPKIQKELKLKLSELFPAEFVGSTYSVNQMLELFSGVGKKSELKELFKVRKYHYKDEMAKKLLEKLDYTFDAKDCIFWHFYMLETEDTVVLSNLSTFIDLYESDNALYKKEAVMFLDYCVAESIEAPLKFFTFPDFVPAEKIWSEAYTIDSELVPEWLNSWINGDKSKVNNLISIGLNGDDSNVVKFRKGIEAKNKDAQDTTRSLLGTQLLQNTLIWLKENAGSIALNTDVLKSIYQSLQEREVSMKKLLIPIIKRDTITLKYWVENDIYHLKNATWGEYESYITDAINSNGQYVLDNILPLEFRTELNAVDEPCREIWDEEKLLDENNIEEFGESFYQDLIEHPDASKINIYKGDALPFRFQYYDIIDVESESEEEFTVLDSGEIVVCQKYATKIPENIRTTLDNNFYTALLQKKVGEKELDKGQDIDLSKSDYQFSEEEEKALNLLFDGQPPVEFYKDWNVAALIRALLYLPGIGYDVDEAKIRLPKSHKYAQLESVNVSGNTESEYVIMCRSAANGLLYMTTQAWERLANTNIHLFVSFGRGHKIFQNQQEVLDHAMRNSDFQIMRIMTEPTAGNINDVLNGNFDKKKVWLVFKMKSDEKIDYLFKKWEPNDIFDTDEGNASETPDTFV